MSRLLTLVVLAILYCAVRGQADEKIEINGSDYDLFFPSLVNEATYDGPGAVACFEITDSIDEYPPINTRGFFIDLSSDGAGTITVNSFDFVHTTDDEGTFAVDASITTVFTPGVYDDQGDQTILKVGVENNNFDATFADYIDDALDGYVECWVQDFADDVAVLDMSLSTFSVPILSTAPRFFTMTCPSYKLLRR